VFSFAPVQAADDAAVAARRASLERIQALRRERPGDGLLVYYQAMTHIALGERDAAFDLLRSLKGRKLGLVPVRDMGFDAVWDDPKFQAVRKELADEEPETPAAPVVFRLEDPNLIPEGIAYDPKSKRFFLGSSRGKIIATDGKGEPRDFSGPDDKLAFVLGLAVDAKRGHLYAVSTNGFLDAAKTERRNEVVRYDLKDGRLLDRFAAPEALQLNDLVIAPDGTLYVTDSMNGSLFRKKPDEKTLTGFGTTGAVRGANGIALKPDGALYVAISTGIARVDLASGEPTRLPQPDTVATGGIDGMYWHDGDLFAVQNVTNPGRVVRIHLSDDGNRIEGLTVLQSHHHPEFAEPTTGVIANDALHVIANSHVTQYQPDGTIKDPAVLRGTAVIAVPLQR
jgi:sugar lactone lactonase YvrE